MERIEQLTEVVTRLSENVTPLGPKIDLLAERYDTRTRWVRASFIALAVVLVALVVAAVAVEVHTQADIAESNRKLCPMISLLVPAPGGEQPRTQYGQQLAEQARLLYAAYGCPPAN